MSISPRGKSVNIAQAFVPAPGPLREAVFLRREKRFSVLCEQNGKQVWAHTNNTGAMLGLTRKNAPAMICPMPGAHRKLPFTLERLWCGGKNDGFWTGVNTALPNQLLQQAFLDGQLPFCAGYANLKREARFGASRFDACATADGLPELWIECKSVTLVEDGMALFPDAASERARKHMVELMELVKMGKRAAMFFLVQRPDGQCLAPADFIDEAYGRLFYEGKAQGVEIYAYRAELRADGAALGGEIPVHEGNNLLWI